MNLFALDKFNYLLLAMAADLDEIDLVFFDTVQ